MSQIPTIEAVLFDMDGVLASVGSSYRESIVKTCAHFSVMVTHDDITVEKKKGNANNDWVLSKRLIESKSQIEVSLDEVTQVFEDIYQGSNGSPGLCETELLIPSKGFIEEIYRRVDGKVAVVTGRPRKDCMKFLKTHNIEQYFSICICMEDGPPKPSPIPVLLACNGLNILPSKCVIIGDTPDDIRAGISANTLAWGVLTPEENAKITLGLLDISSSMKKYLIDAGATLVMNSGMLELLNVIPSKLPLSNVSETLI